MPTPFTDYNAVKEVLKYRRKNKPLSFRAIGEKLNKDVKSVYRLYRKGIGKQKMRLKI
jgi:hypothetical protein